MQALWLRYLTEINDKTREISADLLENPEIKKAISVLEESAFTDAQLLGYEKFWDAISVEKTLYNSGWRKGVREGKNQGWLEGKAEGKAEMQYQIAANLKKAGIPIDIIAQNTDLTEEEIEKL